MPSYCAACTLTMLFRGTGSGASVTDRSRSEVRVQPASVSGKTAGAFRLPPHAERAANRGKQARRFMTDATIALMAKFKPVRGRKGKPVGPPQGAVSCVILVVAGMLLVMFFMYFVMKNANG